jgi:hypothetical protein
MQVYPEAFVHAPPTSSSWKEPVMPDMPSLNPQPTPELRERLLECARLLRSTRHIDPDAQVALSELFAELATCADLESPGAPTAHLAETSAQLVHALHHQHDEGLIASATDRLKEVAARAEAEAPVATGVVRRFIDALSGIGI